MIPFFQSRKNSIYYIVSILLLGTLHCKAQPFLDVNSNYIDTYNALISLQVEAGKQYLTLDENENDPIHILLEDYHFLLHAFFSETDSLYNVYLKENDNLQHRLFHTQHLSQEKYFVTAELLLHSAICKAKFGEYFSSFFEIRKAYKLFQQNIKRHPEYLPNYKSLGMLQALLSTAPDNLKWGLRLLSLDGDVVQGLEHMEYFLQKSQQEDLFVIESKAAVLYILHYLLNDKDRATVWMDNEMQDNTNLLYAFLKGNIYFKLGQTEKAIHIIEERPQGQGYIQFDYLEYLLGKMKLTNLDVSAAKHFKTFLSSFKGRHYIKAANQKLAWIALLENNEQQYHAFIEQCLTQGAAEIGEDKKAYKDAMLGSLPNLLLLKAQLQFDGGFYQDAIEYLHQMEIQTVTALEFIEYHYRLGRSYSKLDDADEAIEHLQQVIVLQQSKCLYYGPKAAIECGKIYEAQMNYPHALSSFKKALEFSGHPYKNSLDQEAKAGIQRVNPFL